MESYIVRIYRRNSAEEVSGLLIDSIHGSEHPFQTLEQLGSHLEIGPLEAGRRGVTLEEGNGE